MVIVCKCGSHLRFQTANTAFADGNFLIECGKAINKHCHIQFLTFQDVHVQKCQCRKLGIQYGGELIHILMKTKASEKIKETLLKVFALSEKGIGGEKEAAAKALQRLLKNHQMTIGDLTDVPKRHKIKYGDEMERRVAVQTIASFDLTAYKLGGRKTNDVYVDCTEAAFLEITAKYQFYLSAWREKVSIFMDAFITQNELWRPSNDDACDYVPSEADMARWKIQQALQKGMKADIFYKTISSKKTKK